MAAYSTHYRTINSPSGPTLPPSLTTQGPTNKKLRIHLPLIVPEGQCFLRAGDETVCLQEGRYVGGGVAVLVCLVLHTISGLFGLGSGTGGSAHGGKTQRMAVRLASA